MARRDSNIDPFNAGEPVLPWDDPSQIHDESCAFQDDAYKAPRKSRDNYDPPAETDATPSRSSLTHTEPRRRSEEERICSAQSKTGSVPQDTASPAPRQFTYESREGKRPPRRPKRTKHPVRAFFTLLFIWIVVSGAIGAVFEFIELTIDNTSSSYSWNSDDYDYELTLDIDNEAGELAIAELFEVRYSALTDNEEVRARIAASFSSECETYLGYTAAELCCDANAYATWLISGFSYTARNAYCDDGYNDENPDGTVYFESTGYDAYDANYNFFSRAFEYLTGEGINPIGTEDLPALDDAQKSLMRQHLAEVMTYATASQDLYSSQAFYYSDGEWKMDEDDFYANIDGFFS